MNPLIKSMALAGCLSLPSFAIYTGPRIVAYQLSGSDGIAIDGKRDATWDAIANKASGKTTVNFQDMDRLLYLGPDSIKNKDISSQTPPSKGEISLTMAYDSKFVYAFFEAKDDYVFDGSNQCGPEQIWRADAIELFIDPSPWTTTVGTLAALFRADADSRAFGTSANTIQFAKPIHGNDSRLFYADRFENNQFVSRPGALTSGQRFPGFQVASGADTKTGITTLELKIPHTNRGGDRPWGTFTAGRSMYITFAYNNYLNTHKSDCTDSPVKHAWSKNIKEYTQQEWVSLTGSTKGWAPGDKVQYDPTDSFDGWGELYLSTETVGIKARTHLPTQQGFEVVGSQLRVGQEKGRVRFYTSQGRYLEEREIRDSKVDLASLGLERGLYFGQVNGKRFSFLY